MQRLQLVAVISVATSLWSEGWRANGDRRVSQFAGDMSIAPTNFMSDGTSGDAPLGDGLPPTLRSAQSNRIDTTAQRLEAVESSIQWYARCHERQKASPHHDHWRLTTSRLGRLLSM
jgi:hypothetical protein